MTIDHDRYRGDYHVHTKYCGHAVGDVSDYVEQALRVGLDQIGFAEHIPVPGLDDPDGRVSLDDFERFIADVEDARVRFGDEIEILLGLEADYLPSFLDEIAQFINGYSFDYVIGSVHFIDDWDFSHPKNLNRFDEYGVDWIYQRYYALVQQAAQTNLYQAIGHLDVVKKFGHDPDIDLVGQIGSVLEVIRQNNLALDVNTSGWRRDHNELYPGPELLRQAHQLGVPVLLGSDAHHPGDVAAGFDRAENLLYRIGYRNKCAFKQQERIQIPIRPISDGMH